MHQSIDRKKNIIIYLIIFFLLSTTTSKNLINKKSYSIKINKIDVSGLSISNNLKIINKLNNLNQRSIFFLKKEKINEVISEFKIIEKYTVKKIYPKKLDIKIQPTKFIAKISGNKKILVGANGKLIENEVSNEILPNIFGEFNSKEFMKFKKEIERAELNFKNFKSLFYHSSNRWDILTNNEILIKLPNENFYESLKVAKKIINDDKLEKIKLIDLRILNQVIIR